MPKSKEMITDSSSNSGSADSEEETKSKSKAKKPEKKKAETSPSEDSESEEETKSKKRSKKSKEDKASNKKAKKEDADDTWDIGNNKQVNVRSFKGKWFVDIREMYLDKGSGELKPGKKGICMNFDNWRAFAKIFEEVDECVKSKC